jgi:hypothetical protein
MLNYRRVTPIKSYIIYNGDNGYSNSYDSYVEWLYVKLLFVFVIFRTRGRRLVCTLTILDPQLTTENGSVYMCVGVKVSS